MFQYCEVTRYDYYLVIDSVLAKYEVIVEKVNICYI